jgi:hypothetical protein|tara:strand:- start:1629 stop:1796 length:168 start_codon:yes stop_codon:yes gene_type:complete
MIKKLLKNLNIPRRRKLGNRLPKSRMIENTPKNNGKRNGEFPRKKEITNEICVGG